MCRLYLLVACCLISACFDAPLPSNFFKCSAQAPDCPEGQTCDLFVGKCTDTPTTDTTPANCTSLLPGDATVLTCSGVFSAGKAGALCPVNYSVCKVLPATHRTACLAIRTGVYFSGVVVNAATQAKDAMACAPPAGSQPTGMAVCGLRDVTSTTTYCQGWAAILACSAAPATGLSAYCPVKTTSLNDVVSNQANNGVVCCR